MKFQPILLLAFSGSSALSEIAVLGVECRASPSIEYPIQASEPFALRVLLPPNVTPAQIHAEVFQIAGSSAQPLPCKIAIVTSPDDPRIGIVKLTPPAVARVTRLALRVQNGGTINLLVYPAPKDRADRPALVDALRASGIKLAVCGRSTELRAFLSTHALEFEDHGTDAPDTLTSGTLLIGELPTEDWKKLTIAPAKGGMLAFVTDSSTMPGVYSYSQITKVTLPLLSSLAADPRAEQTLFTLLLTAFSSSSP